MEHAELKQLDTLLHKLLAEEPLMEGLSLLERKEIAGASETICSLIRRQIQCGPRAGPEQNIPE